MTNTYWYAVLSDREDNDWGTGSFDRNEAEQMLASYPDGLIAVIDGNYDEDGNATSDEICIEEIWYEDVFGSSPLIDNGPYIEADICTPDYELIQPASVCRHPERNAYVDKGYLLRYEGRVYFVEPPHPSNPDQRLPVLFSCVERDWPCSEVEEDDGETYYADDNSVIDLFPKEG